MRKIQKLTVCLLALLLLLTGCRPTTPPTQDPPAVSGTLTVWVGYPFMADYDTVLQQDPTNGAALFTQKTLTHFQEKYPQVTIRYEYKGWGTEQYENILAADANDTLPDILVAHDGYFGYYQARRILQPVEISPQADLIPSALGGLCYDGAVYGVPVFTGNMMLYSNQNILNQYGLSVPQTMEELMNFSKTIYTQSGGSVGGTLLLTERGLSSLYRLIPYMRLGGGDFADANGNLTLYSPENVATFTYLRELMQYAPSDVDARDYGAYVNAFMEGRAAFVMEHTSLVFSLGEAFRSDYVPVFSGHARSNMACGAYAYGITRQCSDVSLANLFLNSLLDEEIQIAAFLGDARLPVTNSALSSILSSTDSQLVEKRTGLLPAISMLQTDTYNGGLPNFTQDIDLIWSYWDAMLEGVFYSDQPIDSIIQNTHDAIAEVLQSAD